MNFESVFNMLLKKNQTLNFNEAMFISSFSTFIIATFNCPKNKIQLGAIPVNKNTDAAEVSGEKTG
jgi:hypothetical protein